MDDNDWLAMRFEDHRTHLRAVAYRMLGSLTEADDAVQEAWLRLARTDTSDVENLGGWLTTVVGRVCLDMLRSRRARKEDPASPDLPDPVVGQADTFDPEHQALLANSVGLALLVVLDTLDPAERLAFVLHDMFGLPFDEIAPVIGRSNAATRQLASRARRRVRGVPTTPDPDLGRQRTVVDAFFAAARDGDFDRLVAVLDPDVVLRSAGGPLPKGAARTVRGAETVASQALLFRHGGTAVTPEHVLVNGAAGLVVRHAGKPIVLFGFTVIGDRIVEIDILADRERVAALVGE